jgi:hypothetical protein
VQAEQTFKYEYGQLTTNRKIEQKTMEVVADCIQQQIFYNVNPS